MKDSHTLLKELLSGKHPDVVSQGFKANIMDRIIAHPVYSASKKPLINSSMQFWAFVTVVFLCACCIVYFVNLAFLGRFFQEFSLAGFMDFFAKVYSGTRLFFKEFPLSSFSLILLTVPGLLLLTDRLLRKRFKINVFFT